MEEIRCIKCGRPLRDPDSIARGMGPECAGGHRIRYRSGVHAHGNLSYVATSHFSQATSTLFTLISENEQKEEQQVIEEVASPREGLARSLIQFPAALVDLVLSAPAAGAIAGHVKNYSRRKKPKGSIPPGRILQEIRRMCIELRLTFWPGIIDQGQQVACIPHGEENWIIENSEKVISRQELEAYLSRYGMIRSSSG